MMILFAKFSPETWQNSLPCVLVQAVLPLQYMESLCGETHSFVSGVVLVSGFPLAHANVRCTSISNRLSFLSPSCILRNPLSVCWLAKEHAVSRLRPVHRERAVSFTQKYVTDSLYLPLFLSLPLAAAVRQCQAEAPTWPTSCAILNSAR